MFGICVHCNSKNVKYHFNLDAYCCMSCNKMSTVQTIMHYIASFKQQMSQAQQAAARTRDCPYCSKLFGLSVPMQENPYEWMCKSCGHIEKKTGTNSCFCRGCTLTGASPQFKQTFYGQTINVQKPYFSPWSNGPNNMTPQPANIRIWWDATIQAYRLSSPYNKTLVDALKQHIPASDRSYDDTSKQWIITEKFLQPLQGVLKLMSLQAVIITRQQAESAATHGTGANAGSPATRSHQPLDTVIVEWVRLLPYDAAKAAYRRAALDLHPDKNQGNATRMTSLNAAWDRIAKEVYGQQ